MNLKSTGFPSGCFLIKSVQTERLLDVKANGSADGTQVIVYPEQEKSWVESFRDPSRDNQVFFVDETGALSSKASGHAIDVQDGSLVLRHRRPITVPFPNGYSHPLPRFAYNAASGQISVTFSIDPSQLTTNPTPTTSATQNDNWSSKVYILTTVPLRKQNTAVEDASEFITNTASILTSPITRLWGPASPRSSITADDISRGDFDLREDETMELDRAAHEELDDSNDLAREVQILALNNDRALDVMSDAARRRTHWQIIPILREKVRTGASGQ